LSKNFQPKFNNSGKFFVWFCWVFLKSSTPSFHFFAILLYLTIKLCGGTLYVGEFGGAGGILGDDGFGDSGDDIFAKLE
jgi:hypothetical protein